MAGRINDAKEGVGGITPPKLNRGGWNSARTKYFERNVVCKNLGAIGSGAAEGSRKTSLGDPKKTWLFCLDNHARSHPLPVGRFSRNFRENTWICVLLNPFGAEFWNFFVKGSFTPKNLKKAFFGYPHAPRATAQGIHFRSTAIVQSVSGDDRDVPFDYWFFTSVVRFGS